MFLSLPKLVDDLLHLDERVLDLIEIGGYIFIADRLTTRGRTDSLLYDAWARSLEFHIRVRDFAFWANPSVNRMLSDLLVFLTGDRSYSFTFYPGHTTPAASLFDAAGVGLRPDPRASVLLFSGGLDSLGGAVDLLSTTAENVHLVSHRTQSRIIKTQRGLVRALEERFPGRVWPYTFKTNLQGANAPEESQRSRAFLYCCIGYAVCSALGLATLNVFENGVTSLNFPKRQDLVAGRASRTTHPQTLNSLSRLFSAVSASVFKVVNPYQWKTKTDVVSRLSVLKAPDLISSSVSCGRGRTNQSHGTHCGVCSQCVDRRIALFASGLARLDDQTGIYNFDFVREPLIMANAKGAVIDYFRQAAFFGTSNAESFRASFANELIDVLPFLDIPAEEKAFETVRDLTRRHGEQVADAMRVIRTMENPLQAPAKDSIFEILALRPYLKPDVNVASLVTELDAIKPGRDDAFAFQEVGQRILEAVFAPELVEPHPQVKTEDGLEVRDITFHNIADRGFWHDMKMWHRNSIVVFEMKNMVKLAGPEFAQILSRLNDRRGNLGFLVARRVNERAEKRVLRVIQDQGKVVLVLCDDDLKEMLRLLALGQSATQHVALMYRQAIESA